MLTQEMVEQVTTAVKCKERIYPLLTSGFHSEFMKDAWKERSGGEEYQFFRSTVLSQIEPCSQDYIYRQHEASS